MHLGNSRVKDQSRKGKTVPIASSNKTVNKRKVARSPLQRLNLRRSVTTRPSTTTRRKLCTEKDPKLSCHKAGPSTKRASSGTSNPVFIPGVTIGGVDFWPSQSLFLSDIELELSRIGERLYNSTT